MAEYTFDKIKYGNDVYKIEDATALHSMPIATNETVGGVKGGGSGISIAADGTISSTAAGKMVWYGTCSTTANTAAKVVTCSGYTLQAGSIIGILFTTANTAATPTLNVNSTTAKSIYIGATAPDSTTNVLKWSSNTMVYFMYDGTYYRYITSVSAGSVTPSRGANTWYGISNSSATDQAKSLTLTNYVLTTGSLVSITFSYANTYTSAKITLNINNTGAKDIYTNGAVTSSTNTLLWDANETLTFMYNGTGYYFLCKSKQQSGGITTETDPIFVASDAYNISFAGGVSALQFKEDNVTGEFTLLVSGTHNFELVYFAEDGDQTNHGGIAIAAPDSYSTFTVYDAASSIGLATTSSNGYMSSSDKVKLNNLIALTNTEIDNAVAAAVTVANGNNIQY